MSRRKTIWVTVKVSAPPVYTAAQIRREVRTLINEMTTYSADPGEIKALAVRPSAEPRKERLWPTIDR